MFGWLKKREPVAGAAALNVVIANLIVQIAAYYAPDVELSTTEIATIVGAVFTVLTGIATIVQRSKVTPVDSPRIYPYPVD